MPSHRARHRPWAGDRARTAAGIALLLLGALAAQASPPRNIILFVADGSGFYHIDAAGLYQYGRTGAQAYEAFPLALAMSTYNVQGNGYQPLTFRDDFGYADLLATGSAGAASAMATGRKTREYLSLDMDGVPLENFTQRAKTLGKAAGVVTSVQVSDATPAAFVAHHDDRNDLVPIAQEMFLDSRLDVIMGCGNPCYDNDGGLVTPSYYDYVGGSACWNGLVTGNIDFDLNGDGVTDNRV
jgi:alkaline phosphatase